MTFYNPNIQLTFDKDTREFVELRGAILASYRIVYKSNESRKVGDIGGLDFIRFENRHQQTNLLLVDSAFPVILSDIATKVIQGRLHTFQECLEALELLIIASEEYDKLYFKNKLQQFLELLLYSDIASKHASKGETNFNRIYCVRSSSDELNYYTLYDRLKIYDFLIREMKLEIDLERSDLKSAEICLCLRFRT